MEISHWEIDVGSYITTTVSPPTVFTSSYACAETHWKDIKKCYHPHLWALSSDTACFQQRIRQSALFGNGCNDISKLLKIINSSTKYCILQKLPILKGLNINHAFKKKLLSVLHCPSDLNFQHSVMYFVFIIINLFSSFLLESLLSLTYNQSIFNVAITQRNFSI